MQIDPMTPEGRAELRRIATDGWMIRPHHVLALLAALDDAECEIERQRGDLVIERRRAEAAEAALERVRAMCRDTGAYQAMARRGRFSSARVLAVEILAATGERP
ncbi:MAG: hypothetical protein ACI38R_22685 [Rhodococcus sp. (in: high G+C Gram-positive bacteria)]